MRKRKDAPSRQELFAALRRLEAQNAEFERRIEQQAQRIGELERELAKARKNSSTSSKPPSSDIVKPPRPSPPGGKGRRKIGGQPGHAKHERPPFSADAVNESHEYTLDACPSCGGRLQPANETPRVIQQVEVIEAPIRIEEHRGLAYGCRRCRRVHYAPLPPTVEKGGLVGPRLTALIGFLKGACHMSFSTIRKFLRDVVGVTISRGQLCNVLNKVSAALRETYEDLVRRLPLEAYLRVDETGHKENKRRRWTWCFRAEAYTVFHIAETRSSQVLWDLLGEEFNGVLGCDYFSAYRKYMKECSILVQFCLAHLIRDVKYLTTLPDPDTVAYGQDILDALRELFHVFHRREQMSEPAFAAGLAHAREAVLAAALIDAPPAREVQNLADRFRQHGEAYFQFITTPGVDPTNNRVEQAIRFVIIDRLITQGTRSPKGRTWCERIWTVLATCVQQGRSAFNFLCEAVEAHFTGRPPPVLLGLP
ncbi:MAG: IS66 family transposase [Gemmatimonadetes bacterium]|nr:IS66 family transposase [Gemmatimonadota bacterium]